MVELSNKDSYKELYAHQKYQYEIEKNAYGKLEDKASKYLASLTVVITTYTAIIGIFLKNFLVNLNSIVSFLCIFLIVFAFIFFCLSWYSIFRCLRLQEVFRLESNQEMIDYFLDQDYLETVYLELSEKYNKATQQYIKQNEKKINLIKNGYSEILVGVLSSVILIFIVFLIQLGTVQNERSKAATTTATTCTATEATKTTKS
ncbi:hypothetical protein [Acinetobacter bereziniae]|nr:hypothetical protein [Acinetobacter bereziniae]MCV2445029.1 hypothetical protein [Acinetobacter bereziniae]